MSEEQKKILQMVEGGQISPEEAATLLQLVSEPEEAVAEPQATATSEEPGQREADWPRIRPYWLYPLWGGLLLFVIGGTTLATTYPHGRVTVVTWLCGWIPLFLGALVATLAAWARTARWIHLRVVGQEGRVALHFPLPLGLGAFVLGIARRFSPKLRETGIDEAILALRDGLRDGRPIRIEVQDDEEGEHVQILIG